MDLGPNLHCGILFDVTDEQGNVVHWGAELGNPHMLSSAGFGKDLLKPGDQGNHQPGTLPDPPRPARGVQTKQGKGLMAARRLRWVASRGMATKRTRITVTPEQPAK